MICSSARCGVQVNLIVCKIWQKCCLCWACALGLCCPGDSVMPKVGCFLVVACWRQGVFGRRGAVGLRIDVCVVVSQGKRRES